MSENNGRLRRKALSREDLARNRVSNKKPYDPTKVRMSKYFLLSDFMGCHSVYSKGLTNQIFTTDNAKLERGYMLAETLDALEDELGVISVGYGFLSPSLSQMLVTYQDPNKPSFHRWELGAACDIQFMEHDYTLTGRPSIHKAAEILTSLGGLEFARMITYAESPWICFATSDIAKESTRRIYEYRHRLNNKPEYVKWTGNEAGLQAALDDGTHGVFKANGGNWVGAGYPTYHSHKIRQLHHERIGSTVNLSDMLYSRDAVHYGKPNAPIRSVAVHENFLAAADILSRVHAEIGHRVSVVSAYENPLSHVGTTKDYTRGFSLDLVMPENDYMDAEALEIVAAAIAASNSTHAVAVLSDESTSNIQRINIRG